MCFILSFSITGSGYEYYMASYVAFSTSNSVFIIAGASLLLVLGLAHQLVQLIETVFH